MLKLYVQIGGPDAPKLDAYSSDLDDFDEDELVDDLDEDADMSLKIEKVMGNYIMMFLDGPDDYGAEGRFLQDLLNDLEGGQREFKHTPLVFTVFSTGYNCDVWCSTWEAWDGRACINKDRDGDISEVELEICKRLLLPPPRIGQ